MSLRLLVLVAIFGMLSCTQREKQMNVSFMETFEKSISVKDDRQFVSDTLKRIINELNLCQYSEHLNFSNYYSCYDKNLSDIRLIKKGDKSYQNFIFQAPGGSAGGAIVIFISENGKYKEVQNELGCVIDILSSTTNGFFDLIIWHRAQKAGGEYHLYRWNNEKYISKQTFENYNSQSTSTKKQNNQSPTLSFRYCADFSESAQFPSRLHLMT